jgi:hypothetical protein
MNKNIFIILIMTVMISSCYYDSEEDLYPSASCQAGTNLSYKTHIEPILINSCYTCHSKATQNGSVNIEGHAQLKIYLANGRFIGSIKHLSGFSQMPQGAPQLPACNILKIEKWIAEGALNN